MSLAPRRPRPKFAIKADADGKTIEIEISEKAGVQADNLGLATWGSSFILANTLHRYKDTLPTEAADETGIAVLELGAGTGLVGLAAALIWQRPVTFTDLRPILPGIAQNIALNAEHLAKTGVATSYGTLDWLRPETLQLCCSDPESAVGVTTLDATTSKAQIIMAADTCYSEEHPQLMTQTIVAWLAPGPAARVFITYAQRVAYLDQIRELWERLEDAGLECFDEGVEVGDESWDEDAPFEWTVWKWKE